MTRPTKTRGGLRLRGAGGPGQGGVRRCGRELQVQLGSGRALGFLTASLRQKTRQTPSASKTPLAASAGRAR